MVDPKYFFSQEERAKIIAESRLPNGDFSYQRFLELLEAARTAKMGGTDATTNAPAARTLQQNRGSDERGAK